MPYMGVGEGNGEHGAGLGAWWRSELVMGFSKLPGKYEAPYFCVPACVVCNVRREAELVLSFERACGPLPDSRMWFYWSKREKNPCWDQCERP